MELQFLGTAAAEGWPGLFCQCDACQRARQAGGRNIRTRSSCLVDKELLVDFPPDTYMHVLHNRLDLGSIRHLIVTHSHQDHFYPEDLDMRKPPFAHLQEKELLHIYGNDKVGEKLRQRVDMETMSGYIEFHEISPFQSFRAGKAVVTPMTARHDPNEKCLIYLIEMEGKHVLYGHDTGYFPEETWEFLKGKYLDGVILDCTSGPMKEGNYHMGFPDNRRVKERLLEEGTAGKDTLFIITHFSHNGELLYDELVAMAAPYGFKVTFDGAVFEV